MTLRHNFEYRHSLPGLPILVLEWSKWDQLEGVAPQRDWKFGFFRGKMLMKWAELFMAQSQSPDP